ncbi:ABC-three component system protein [Burkholderia cepacia]|uniref:ABC-three component system protein n=1 Tax=Burkholderia cepacia TaxID=292 RepID=UPI002AB6B83F|nr:ABC-three component system protein [Burkholderia cepacia]
MDELQRSIYVDRFRLAFHTLKGTAFQDWFVRLSGYAFGADFEEVRPYGPYGDMKCDGRRISNGSVFQCYAPDAMKETELIAKIDEDFHGARTHWSDAMQEWIFVHNDGRGLPPHANQHIDRLRKAHAPLKLAIWSEPELHDLAMGLNLSALQALFGPAASIAIVDRLVMADLVPIIEALQRQEPSAGDPPLTPPSAEKLEKNALSEESGLLLRIGRRKSVLVDTFFRKSPRPDLGERIAEAFRMRYAELRAYDLPAETIFRHLQDYAGFNGEPKRQGAALAVLAYFFDSCDIFEDPAISTEAS